jgi:hypothetical protein
MYESELKGPDVPCMKHLRRSAGFGRARLNTSLAIRSGSQKQRPVRGNDWRRRELRGRAVPAVRHVTWWLDRPQPAPGWGRFSEQRTSSGLAARRYGFRSPEAEREGGHKLRRLERPPERCCRGRRGFKSERQGKCGQMRSGNGTRGTGHAFDRRGQLRRNRTCQCYCFGPCLSSSLSAA